MYSCLHILFHYVRTRSIFMILCSVNDSYYSNKFAVSINKLNTLPDAILWNAWSDMCTQDRRHTILQHSQKNYNICCRQKLFKVAIMLHTCLCIDCILNAMKTCTSLEPILIIRDVKTWNIFTNLLQHCNARKSLNEGMIKTAFVISQ